MRSIRHLSQALAAAAERNPSAPGLRFRRETLTWETYVRRADAVARTLRELGVRRGDRVGLFLGKGIEAGPSLFGILLAGAAYVPLDPLAPPARVRFMLENCDVAHVVADAARLPTLRQLEDTGLLLASVLGVPAGALAHGSCVPWDEVRRREGGTPVEPPNHASEEDLAYVMFTSGSTGTPKGIMHTHRSGLAFARWAARQFALRADDRIANHAPLHFDLSTFDYFAAPLAGASTLVIPEEYLKVPASHARLLADEDVTVLYAVPFALIQLLLRGGLDRVRLPHLRWVLFAGEPMPTPHLRRLMAAWPHARFANLYGPAEVNVCTHYEVPPLPEDDDSPIPIGRPCPDVETLVLDEDDSVVDPGRSGELLVDGPTRMTGYWKRPDLDRTAFLHRDPGDGRTRRYYRTGDLVRERPDGHFEFLGRRDRQVKIRGHRVELDEVEAALVSHPSLEEAAALALPDGEGSRRIVAAATLREASALPPQELLHHARARLPWYAVPDRVVILDTLPHNGSGKIDRRALEQHLDPSRPSTPGAP